jgi:hypothetical protein
MQKYYSTMRAPLIVSVTKTCEPRNGLAAVAQKRIEVADLKNGWIN